MKKEDKKKKLDELNNILKELEEKEADNENLDMIASKLDKYFETHKKDLRRLQCYKIIYNFFLYIVIYLAAFGFIHPLFAAFNPSYMKYILLISFPILVFLTKLIFNTIPYFKKQGLSKAYFYMIYAIYYFVSYYLLNKFNILEVNYFNLGLYFILPIIMLFIIRWIINFLSILTFRKGLRKDD
jgi:hypothetical protein